MPLKHYGIFLAYGPTVDLKKEGLGRLLGAFLQAAAAQPDVRFVVACPQWSQRGFLAFCEGEGIPAGSFDLVTTQGIPFLLRVYLALRAPKRPRRRNRLREFVAWLRAWSERRVRRPARRLVSARTFVPWLLLALLAVAVALVLAPALLAVWLVMAGLILIRLGARYLSPFFARTRARGVFAWLSDVINPGGAETFTMSLYRLMQEAEVERMVRRVNDLKHVKAWYSPAAFWPGFNRILAPRLLCIPDVVISEFPVTFAQLDPNTLTTMKLLEDTIRGGSHFVTYSSRTKWDTLVDRYSVNPDDVSVIPHASWDLSPWITVRGFPDETLATRNYCSLLLEEAFASSPDPYVWGLSSSSLRFFFYAAQFRPNKNVLTLLRAYEHLVRERLLSHKLILTGDPATLPEVRTFLQERHLTREVLCLHALSTPQLAACYSLAELSINPSLSEGGFPFTLSEALSVDTPVVMARVPATEEVVADPSLQEMMLFDPYDWRDTAKRIEWALENRETLLNAQREFFAQLRQRTWSDVVREYIAVLDRIAADAPRAGEAVQ
jgi:glycosyltransferase involved in cell wall biosynthesis